MKENTDKQDKRIPVIGIAGWSGSGKTTLLVNLIRAIRESASANEREEFRITVIKHDAHGIVLTPVEDPDIKTNAPLYRDTEGKDSWKFRKAGADRVILCGPKDMFMSADVFAQAFIMKRIPPSVNAGTDMLDTAMRLAGKCELILVEGFKNGSLPQIGIARKENGKGLTAEPGRFLAVVTDDPDVKEKCRKTESHSGIPVFGLDQYRDLAVFLKKSIGIRMEQEVENKENVHDFTHFNDQGRARMVDVGEKPVTERTAVAAASVLVNKGTFALIQSGGMKKGDVLTVAQIAGIMGAKRTPDLIPMCHPVQISGTDIRLELDEERLAVNIRASVKCTGKTGVEMEALTAASVAALTVYDMCKAVQKDMVITDLRLLEKTGGVHGDYSRSDE